jgi:menaquinone-dependent protoporphyrinogen IX oxidase
MFKKKIFMKAAIIYSTKYGSTAQYARWIGEETGLPVFNIKNTNFDLSKYDFLILGSPIIYYKVHNWKWVNKNLPEIEKKPIIFFTVSGAPAGRKLDGWIADSLPQHFISKMHHVTLRGRQNPKELRWWDRLMLIIGSMKNPDPVASKEELEGFDFMDRTSIEPILKLVEQFQSSEAIG